MKDNKSLLLVLLSFGLVGTWIYHLYDKNKVGGQLSTKQVNIDTQAIIKPYLDSMQAVLMNSSLASSMNTPSVDSLQGQLSGKLQEIQRLKSQIQAILKKQNISSTDLQSARDMIRELRFRVEDMQVQNTDLEKERGRLSDVMAQLNTQVDSLQNGIRKLDEENKKLTRQVVDASLFVATSTSLKAMNLRSGNKEVPTASSKKAKKLVVSFDVQNNAMNFPNAELVIVVKDPNGKTITEDIWGSGSFDTRTEGRISFTRKVRFDYTKGEPHNILFSLSPDEFLSGTYQLLVFQNGVRIGKTTLGLN